MNETITEMINRYEAMLAQKQNLEDQMKDLGRQIESLKQTIIDQMVNEDMPMVGVGEYKYSIKGVTKWNKLGDAKLEANGIGNFFQFLRDVGMGDIITERVDPRTLNKTVNEIVDQNDGELPEYLEPAFSKYEYTDLSRTKSRTKKAF